jgi:hypothetical protein
MNNTKKLNWNGLTDQQQEFTESIVNNQVFTICNQLILDADEYVEFDNYWNEEEEVNEIYVYYIVSEWLYKELQNINACVTEYKGLYIWGRCDFNQGLDMNYELKTIAKNIIKEA